MARLLLLTHRYPYPPGEEFLEAELPYLARAFDHVDVVPTGLDPANARPAPILPPGCSLRTDIALAISAADADLTVSSRMGRLLNAQAFRLFAADLPRALTAGADSARKLTRYVARAILIGRVLRGAYPLPLSEDCLVYSYWLGAEALAAALALPSATLVARAHGGDLYEDRRNPPYLPLQHETITRLDRLYAISNHGRLHLHRRYPDLAHKVHLSRLGVPSPAGRAVQSTDGVGRILSCAYVRSEKRLDLLIEALRLCQDPIEWTHIGSGPDLDRIQQLALQLPSHVRACFTGQLCHSQVIDYYGGHAVDLFVSCSIAEGLPVTIMEAMSFGVPILATGVGGVPELVDDTNGCLLDPAASPDTIAAALTRLLRQGPETRGMLSDASVARWRDLVDANTQFPLFAADLIALLRESTEKRRLEVA
ncbi:MAG: glycosyltransferase [Chloroflexi bacterium]|nr:glycosyltransferase [Chloroflexota bacterium]